MPEQVHVGPAHRALVDVAHGDDPARRTSDGSARATVTRVGEAVPPPQIGVRPCPRQSSFPPPAPPSAAPTRGRSRTCGPTTSPRRSSRRRWTRSPGLDPNTVDDVYLGCGLPGGESGNNMAPHRQRPQRHGRRARRDDHPLLRLLGADHADGVPRDQGRRGRRLRLRRCRDGVPVRQGHLRPLAGHAEPASSTTRWPAPRRPPRAASTGTTRARTAPLPDAYIAMGQTAENVATAARPDREELDEFGVRSQNLAEKAIATASGPARSPRSPPPTAPRSRTDDGPRAGVTYEAVSQLQPVFRPDGVVTAGNCCPLNDGAAAVVIMSDTKAAELGRHAAGADRRHRRERPVPRDHGPRPGRGDQAGARPRGHDHRRHRPGRDQRGVRGAGRAVLPGPRHRPRPPQRQRRRDRGRAPVRHDRRPAPEHDAQLPGLARQDAPA